MKHKLTFAAFGLIMLLLGGVFAYKSQPSTPPQATNAVTELLTKSLQISDKSTQTDISTLITQKNPHYVLINFWGTWCPPCREEIPDLIALQNEHHHLLVVGVSFDSSDKVVRYIKEVKLNYPNLEAKLSDIDMVMGLGAKSAALPYSLLLNQKKEIILQKQGKIETKDIKKLISNIQ